MASEPGCVRYGVAREWANYSFSPGLATFGALLFAEEFVWHAVIRTQTHRESDAQAT